MEGQFKRVVTRLPDVVTVVRQVHPVESVRTGPILTFIQTVSAVVLELEAWILKKEAPPKDPLLLY